MRDGIHRLLFLAWALAVLTTLGCPALWNRGPVPPSVAMCRELSHEGIKAIERGDWPEAENLLKRAIDACPVDADARRHYAETLINRGAFVDSLAQLEEGRRLSRGDVSLTVRAGEVYLMAGEMRWARRRAEQALSMDSTSAAAWVLRGRVMLDEGNSRQALADMHRALGYRPDDQLLLLEIAEIHRQLNQPQRALLAIQVAADTYQAGEEPQRLLFLQGLALLALERNEDAAACLSKACSRDIPTAELYYALGQAEFLAGRLEHARAAVQAALAIESDHKSSRLLMAQIDALHIDGSTRQR